MESIRNVVCPVLVGRDDLLGLADRRLDGALRGSGQLLFVAGEAGIGKTRLLATVERRATALGMRTLRAATYPGDVQVGAAALMDLARTMRRDLDFGGRGARLQARLEATHARDDDPMDPHRRRRSLVLDLAESLAETAADGPVLLAIEDLHWADDLTLEVLASLARRLPDLPLLVVGTYRSDELYPRIPMRDWRARLLTGRLAEEVRLRRLQPEETATMIALILGTERPVAGDITAAVQARTDGIPLHIEELLAVLNDSELTDSDVIAATDAPEAIEDLVHARLRLRSKRATSVAGAGAVIGRSFDLDFLAAVLDATPDELDEPLAELRDHHLLVTHAPGWIGFRHALIGDAIYDRLPEAERRRLHLRTATAAEKRPDVGTDAFLSLHFERAGRPDLAHPVALAGARAATHLSSHREARELFERAVRTMPSDADPMTRARILEALADSCTASDRNREADEAYVAAGRAYREAGRPLLAVGLVPAHVAVRHLLGDDLATRAARLESALAEVDAAGPPTAGDVSSEHEDPARVRARLLAGLGAAYMLDRRLDDAITVSGEAQALAERCGDETTERHAATTLGACYVFAGQMDEGWRLLDDVIASTRSAELEGEAARAYRMIGSSASVLVEYPRAEERLREGIEYAERVEAWNHRHYMAAHLAHVAWATGDWDAAERLATASLADGRGGVTTRITALHVIGYVALGRGAWPQARDALTEARELGTRMRELQRRSPAVWGLAEIARLTGSLEEAVRLVEDGLAASAEVEDAAYLFPYVVTGTRVYLAAGDPHTADHWVASCESLLRRRSIPGTLAAIPHAHGLLQLAGGATRQARDALIEAADAWERSGRIWEATWARVDLARAHLRANQRTVALQRLERARATATALRSAPILAAIDELHATTGGAAAREPWSPLTAREFEVARLVSVGHTNAQIAAELGVAPKTASAHVEHILTKLGVARRAEIATWVGRQPVLHSRPHGEDREE